METIKRKLVIVGDGFVGKTCLLTVFSRGEFPEDYVPTVFENSTANIKVDGREVELRLWDTAGQEGYDRLRPLSYIYADVILMCFSIVSMDSFENILQKWAPEIKHFCPNVPIILVGNKQDLRSSESNKREVTPAQGRDLSDKIEAFSYLECSAKNRNGVNELLETATKATLQEKKEKRSFCVLL